MTLAVRGIAELFRLAQREKDVHREVLAFSISHDHRSVRLYDHYPVFNDSKVEIYRHLIHILDIAILDGKERWTPYHFTLGVYDYSLTLLKRIRSVIDELPPNIIDVFPQQPESPTTGQHNDEIQGGQELASEQLQPITPDTSTQTASKTKRKKGK